MTGARWAQVRESVSGPASPHATPTKSGRLRTPASWQGRATERHPLSYRVFLERKAERCAAVIEAIARSAAAVRATLDGFDVERYLLDAGVSRQDLDDVRQRLAIRD